MSQTENIEDLRNCDCYFTHYNGSRPFAVYINTSTNQIYIYKQEIENDYVSTYTNFVTSFTPQKVFIGQSPLNEMTKYSAGHGDDFDGNSILLKMNINEYIFIGDRIFSFRANHEIVTFVSPIGNNDVPYPYAIDTENNYYFLIGTDSGMLKTTNDGDPYDYYYAVLDHIGESENVECIYIGEDRYKITSSANPEKKYDGLIKRIGGPIYIKFKGEDEKNISKNEYVKLLENYNEKVGLRPLCDFKIIVKQDI